MKKLIFSVLGLFFFIGTVQAAIVPDAVLSMTENDLNQISFSSAGGASVDTWVGLDLDTVSVGGPVGTTLASVQVSPFSEQGTPLSIEIFSATSGLPMWTLGGSLGTGLGLLELVLTEADFLIHITGTLAGTGPALYNLTISTVPIPAAALLFGSALLGMFGFNRRKSAKGNALAA